MLNDLFGVDLFAGAGGLSLGFEQAGFRIAAAVEYDPIHAATHEFNFPNCTTICRSVAGALTETAFAHNLKLGKPMLTWSSEAPMPGVQHDRKTGS